MTGEDITAVDTSVDITATLKGERRVVELSSLLPAPYNPHDITERDVETVAGSIREFGYLETIIVNKHTSRIVAGHTRVRSLIANGYERAEVLFIDLDEVKEKRLNLLLNHQADWDKDRMGDLLASLSSEGVDLDSFGFSTQEIDSWMKGRGDEEVNTEDDDDDWQDMVKGEPLSKLGEVYELGRHRLMCGDATNPKHMETLFQNAHASIAFYSPPYNIGALHVKGDDNTQNKYLTDDDTMDDFSYFSLLQDSLFLSLKYCDETLINIMVAGQNKGPIFSLIFKNIDRLKDVIYWVKNAAAPHIQGGVLNNRVELILAFGDGKRKFSHAQWSQGTMPNVIEGDQNRLNPFHNVHKAVFPIYLPIHILQNFSPPASIVLDPFGGTGTTLIAAERTGRTCYMMEKNPHYCDIIRERYKRELEGDDT